MPQINTLTTSRKCDTDLLEEIQTPQIDFASENLPECPPAFISELSPNSEKKSSFRPILREAINISAVTINHERKLRTTPPEGEISASEAVDWPDGFLGVDLRPKLFDNVTKSWRLLDTGAMLSVVPPQPGDVQSDSIVLEAVDGSKIKTYGQRNQEVRLGRKTFKIKCVIADVKESILGWDFIQKNRLNFIWDQWGELYLQDSRSQIKTRLRYIPLPHGQVPRASSITPESTNSPGQVSPDSPEAQVFYAACVAALGKEEKVKIEPKYEDLINKFPGLLTPSFQDNSTKHNILHKIKIKDGAIPSKAKVRRLMPGSPREVKGKKAWEELVKLGVVERVKADADTSWTSALHLQKKGDSDDLRCCSDFRALNAASIEDMYPLPCLATFTHKLRGAKIFSKVDLSKAFYKK